MGAIRDAISTFSGEDKVKKDLENQLDNMTALARAKANLFKFELMDSLNNAGTGIDKDIPVQNIINFTSQTHAYASSKADKITDTISSAINNFVSGGQENVMNGVSGMMSKAVTALFGSREGGEDQIEFKTVLAEGLSLVRIDLKAWKRFTNVEVIKESAEQISAFVMCKSTIKAETLDYNTFIALYQDNLRDPKAKLSPAEVAKQLDDIKLIYEQFKKNQKNDPHLTTSEHRFPAPSEVELQEAKNAVIKAEQALL